MGVSHQRPLLCSRWMCPIWSEKRRKSTAHQTCSPLQKPPSQGPAVLSLFPHPESPHPFKAPTESFCKAVPPQPSMYASQDIHSAAPCTKSLKVPEGKSPLHFKGKKRCTDSRYRERVLAASQRSMASEGQEEHKQTSGVRNE